MKRRIPVRIAALFLLLLAGAELVACDIFDPCAASSRQAAHCDEPGGDTCLCCCQHVIPAAPFALQLEAVIYPELPTVRVPHALWLAAPIDHPPQL